MIRKLMLSCLSLTNSALLILMLALGSQNLNERQSLNLGISTTEKLPAGFLIGVSIALGSLNGGLATLLLFPLDGNEF